MLLAAVSKGANILECFVNSPASWLCKSGSSRCRQQQQVHAGTSSRLG